jgi:hypothetical protein
MRVDFLKEVQDACQREKVKSDRNLPRRQEAGPLCILIKFSALFQRTAWEFFRPPFCLGRPACSAGPLTGSAGWLSS